MLMDLKTYLKTKNLSPAIFCKMISVSRSTIYNWIRGMRSHRRIAKKVEKITKGEVKMKDMGHDSD